MLPAIACSNVLITQIFQEPPTTISHGLPRRKQRGDGEGRGRFRVRNRLATFYSWRRSENQPGVGVVSGNFCLCGDGRQIQGGCRFMNPREVAA